MNSGIFVAGWTLIHFVWQGALVAVGAAIALRLCRRRSATLRYLLACVALVAMLASLAATSSMLSSTRLTKEPLAYQSSIRMAERDGVGDRPLARSRPEAGSTGGDIEAWLPFVVVIWLGGVTVLLARMGNGWWRVRRLRVMSASEPVSRWQAGSERLAARLRLDVVVRVVESQLIDTPTLVGWLQPMVLLPIASLVNLTPAQVEAILAHELAHVRRHDYAVNLLQALAEALLFYHPAVWWISGRIRLEREHCCDDVAVGICGDPVGYASALTELEAWRTSGTALTLAATTGSLLSRVRRLVGAPATDEARVPGWALAAGLALVIVAAAGGATHLRSFVGGNVAPDGADLQLPSTNVRDPWRLHATDHFDVYFRPALEPRLEKIADQAERAYRQVSEDMRHDLAARVPLILLETQRDRDELLQSDPRAMTAMFTGRHHLLLPLDGPASGLDGLITHELTHQFEFDILPPSSGAPLPVWIAEGLADHERGTWMPRDLAQVREQVVSGGDTRLATSGGGSQAASRRLDNLGHAAFEFIEAGYGKDGIRRFLFGLRRSLIGGASEDVYQAALGVTPEEFDRAFERYLNDRFATATPTPSTPPLAPSLRPGTASAQVDLTWIVVTYQGKERAAFARRSAPYFDGGPAVAVYLIDRPDVQLGGLFVTGFEFIGWAEGDATRVMVFALVPRADAPNTYLPDRELLRRRDFASYRVAWGDSVPVSEMKSLGLEPMILTSADR